MMFSDLDSLQINCEQRTEQIALLQSMRSTPDDRLLALLSNTVHPWKQFSDPDHYQEDALIGCEKWSRKFEQFFKWKLWA